ncbi:hypothetical protein IHE44_0008791 [Lamprotornis superbus]|uniref:Uncharacterized protein n=1 Tax=Lamprotornis superbus TaxID=245042 RepID=A0A835NXI4_9PASS|nr:hypothetical protein IHE44_0008791 [Lamprotornis superbus]
MGSDAKASVVISSTSTMTKKEEKGLASSLSEKAQEELAASPDPLLEHFFLLATDLVLAMTLSCLFYAFVCASIAFLTCCIIIFSFGTTERNVDMKGRAIHLCPLSPTDLCPESPEEKSKAACASAEVQKLTVILKFKTLCLMNLHLHCVLKKWVVVSVEKQPKHFYSLGNILQQHLELCWTKICAYYLNAPQQALLLTATDPLLSSEVKNSLKSNWQSQGAVEEHSPSQLPFILGQHGNTITTTTTRYYDAFPEQLDISHSKIYWVTQNKALSFEAKASEVAAPRNTLRRSGRSLASLEDFLEQRQHKIQRLVGTPLNLQENGFVTACDPYVINKTQKLREKRLADMDERGNQTGKLAGGQAVISSHDFEGCIIILLIQRQSFVTHVSPSKKIQLAVGTTQFLEIPGQQGNTSSETHLPQPDTGCSLNINRADWRATGIGGRYDIVSLSIAAWRVAQIKERVEKTLPNHISPVTVALRDLLFSNVELNPHLTDLETLMAAFICALRPVRSGGTA